ncbi:N-6 DNA methylase [Nocardia tengchongensis]|uniref:N-6 DNA methylase n=1 Tax=Nocardia tengchongensis TaxID=2055889 RepID=A0ABX8CYF9_9NOCA|nr:N-6 DNA methylase [Nocardia tengchongensis]QVI24278.1 N-6 DNA methylase [Nocardia tengchongensis]
MGDQPLVTAADIARYADVTRATVSNWRRRHSDFPAIAGGTEARPLFDFDEVRAWVAARGIDATRSPLSEFRTLVQARVRPEDVLPLLASVHVEHGELAGGTAAPQLSAELLSAIQAVTADAGARTVLEALAERALQGSLEAGAHWTPEPLARLMAQLLPEPSGSYPHSVLDPACGRGGLLIEAARQGAVELYGQDVLPVQTELARLLVALEAGVEPRIMTGDSLLADAFADLHVDAVLCNPPFGQRDWGADQLRFDSRWEYGEPVRIDSELAWVQHGLSHLRPGGTAVFVLPPGVAFRTSGRRIRAALLRGGALQAVIALPGAVLPWTSIPLQLWVLRRPDTDRIPAGKVLFIEASAEREPFDAFADRAVSAWRAFDADPDAFAAIPDIAAAVPVITLLDDAVDLTPGRYTRAPLDPAALLAQIAETEATLSEQVDRLHADFGATSDWSAAQQKSLRTVTISDLAQRGAVRILRTTPVGANQVIPDRVDTTQPMLTGRDLVTGVRASEVVGDLALTSNVVVIEAGDVLLPVVRGTRSDVLPTRVADQADAGVVAGSGVIVLRPDPLQLDPWFLAGFAANADTGATSGISGATRTETNRLRIPMLPLSEQGGYGSAFRRMSELHAVARQAAESTGKYVGLVVSGLTAGALNPPDEIEGRSRWSD